MYRFPGGSSWHKELRETVKSHGYRIVDWNAVCGDEEIRNANAETLLKTTVETSKGKAKVVLLMHDSAPRKATAAALKNIISYFKEHGYVLHADALFLRPSGRGGGRKYLQARRSEQCLPREGTQPSTAQD